MMGNGIHMIAKLWWGREHNQSTSVLCVTKLSHGVTYTQDKNIGEIFF